ncbi:hypothetical protein PPYR_03129 [Photinus pyralis]|uniref:Cytochrome P450 n=1 Tax=Photinus pyralis TaxID=7054 RepID=A0A1Y1KJW1_PHOPY|nr:cytochrome P450 6k1-like [Photinus pyralis]KAB0791329.1 hypothetical protein PPYR_03129 [Photinus pyralis]
MVILLAVLVTFLILSYFYSTRNFDYWKKRNVPHFRPIPLLGTIHSVLMRKKSISQYLCDVYNMTDFCCGGFFIFDKPALVVKDPDLVKNVLMNDFSHFEDRNTAENKEHDLLSAVSLLMLKNHEWEEARSRFTSTLSAGKVKAMLPLVADTADRFVEHVRDVELSREVTECRELSIKYSLDALSSYALGIQANSFQNSDFYQAARNLQNATFSRIVHSICYFFAHMFVKPFRMTFLEPASVTFVTEVFKKNVKLRRQVEHARAGLLEALIKMEGEFKDYNIDIHGLAISLEYLTAGFISSATTLSFSLYDLCVNPKHQIRLRGEIRSVIAKHGGLTYAALREMEYLDMCLKESLRRQPILGFLDRRCTKTYQIPNTDIVIDKGIPVYISLYGLHNDPNYFPDPERYDPERFSPENRDKLERFAFLPFGEGRRNCIGVNFARVIVKMAIVKLLLNFEIVPSKSTPEKIVLEPSGFITIPKHEELNVRFIQLADLPILVR